MKDIYILGIESSCDEAACSIIDEELNILSSVVTAQIDVHARFGGVIPEDDNVITSTSENATNFATSGGRVFRFFTP